MRKSTSIILSLTLLLYSSMANTAQNHSSLADKIEHSVKAKESNWKLERQLSNGKRVVDHWTSNNEEVSVSISELESALEATKQMYASANLIPVSNRKKIKNLGDEANLWESYNHKGATTIHLRQGKVLVYVNASSPGLAKRFAKYVVDQITGAV